MNIFLYFFLNLLHLFYQNIIFYHHSPNHKFSYSLQMINLILTPHSINLIIMVIFALNLFSITKIIIHFIFINQ